jgi:hypothetical protein
MILYGMTLPTNHLKLENFLNPYTILISLDYSRDYFLYLSSSDSTISMVLVQEDYSHDEDVIYYLSRSLMTNETKYMPMEKLALAVVQAIQSFCHYILFHKTTIIFNCNSMQHILTRKLLGGEYSKWIVIL